MDVREKLVEVLKKCGVCNIYAVVQLANALADNGVTVQGDKDINVPSKWISVKDRLPDKRGEYLCYYKFEPDSPDVVCENTYQGSGLWLSEMDKVTHWQPMPQPPKGE